MIDPTPWSAHGLSKNPHATFRQTPGRLANKLSARLANRKSSYPSHDLPLGFATRALIRNFL
jgi:hypothetical protein